ncbi:RNA polymerase I enhancer binding protein [Gamsiella multidivaricata]|nr:RNA polymerase I enhancer binding protein [Gamsiella multidivaricata]
MGSHKTKHDKKRDESSKKRKKSHKSDRDGGVEHERARKKAHVAPTSTSTLTPTPAAAPTPASAPAPTSVSASAFERRASVTSIMTQVKAEDMQGLDSLGGMLDSDDDNADSSDDDNDRSAKNAAAAAAVAVQRNKTLTLVGGAGANANANASAKPIGDKAKAVKTSSKAGATGTGTGTGAGVTSSRLTFEQIMSMPDKNPGEGSGSGSGKHKKKQTVVDKVNANDKGSDEAEKAKKDTKDREIKDRKSDKSNKKDRSSGPASVDAMEDRLKVDMALHSDNPLHTKWLLAHELKEQGITYHKGNFSAQEDRIIRETVRDYIARNNKPEDLVERWFSEQQGYTRADKNGLAALWTEIAVRLETRPLLNIYLHARRMYHNQNNVGIWTKEDDAKLLELYQQHQGQWTTIGQSLGRIADSCRDRYRNHLKVKDTMVVGTWSKEEDEQLLDIMHEQALRQGKATVLESDHMWTSISEKMEGTRSRHQVRHRYSFALLPRLQKGGLTWTKAGAAVAAQKAAEKAKASSVELEAHKGPSLNYDRQLQLDTTKHIVERGYRRHREVEFPQFAEELKKQVQESNEIQVAKFTKAKGQLKKQKKPLVEDGDCSATTFKAAMAAMKAALVAAQEESAYTVKTMMTAPAMSRRILSRRKKVENYNQLPYEEMIKQLQKIVVQSLDKAGKRLEEKMPGRKLPKTTVEMFQEHLVYYAQVAALETLLREFPALHEALQNHRSALMPVDEYLGVSTAVMESAVEAAVTKAGGDKSLQRQLKQQLADRNLAEKLLSDAMVAAGLPQIPERRMVKKPRKRSRPLARSSEIVDDSDDSLTDEIMEEADEIVEDSDVSSSSESND